MNDSKRWLLLLLLVGALALTACSDDGSKDDGLVDLADDQSMDVSDGLDSQDGDQQDAIDQTDVLDSGNDSSDLDTSGKDVIDTSDAVDAVDQTADSPAPDTMDAEDSSDLSDPFAGRPTGQCVDSTDCPAGFCSDAPGGVCVGCGTSADCPGGSECRAGTCIFACEAETDCPPGFECLGSGRCGIIACEQGICPVALYTCGETNPSRCARASCENGEQCPENTTCTSGVCVADRALP